MKLCKILILIAFYSISANAEPVSLTTVDLHQGRFTFGSQFKLTGASGLSASETTSAYGSQASSFGLGGEFDYFLANGFSLGLNLSYAQVSVRGSDAVTILSYGPMFNLFPWSNDHFALKTSLGYLKETYGGIKYPPDRNFILLGVGLSYFVSSSFSIGPSLNFATDVILDGRSPPSHRLAMVGDLNFYF